MGDVDVPTVALANGVQMPLLGLGVWQIPDGKATEDVVAWALEAGYRHVDTARLYGNERSVGRAVAASPVDRMDVFIATKLHPRAHDATRALEESLRLLGTEYVDLYLIHWPTPEADAQWEALERAYERGRARAIGVSNWGGSHLYRTARASRISPHVDQVQFSPFQFRAALLADCHALDVTLEGYSPLSRGRALADPTVVRIAREHGRTPAQVLLRWAIERDVAVIPKSSHRSRILENALIFDFYLDPTAVAALDALDRTGGTASAR
jgi:diketogulonate reductase-like aldo/keto reductase